MSHADPARRAPTLEPPPAPAAEAGPGMSRFPRAFLEAIPKSDLHVHLDGSLRLPTLI